MGVEELKRDLKEQMLENTACEYVIFFLLFIGLYALAYFIMNKFRIRDDEEFFSSDLDEDIAYRISILLCTFTLSVSLCAILLLPFSIASSEALLHYPNSYYIKWLNHSLIQGLWSLVFIYSNISAFILLPFTYLFTKSQGFSGIRKGVISRVYDTLAVISLLIVIVLGITYIVAAIIDSNNSNIETFFNVRRYFLPFLYSCISFLGILLLLLCTPLGFAKLFTAVSNVLVKSQILPDLNREIVDGSLEEDLVRKGLTQRELSDCIYLNSTPKSDNVQDELRRLQNGDLQVKDKVKVALADRVDRLYHQRTLVGQRQTWVLGRKIVYLLSILILILLTTITVVIVLHNTVELLIGIKILTISIRKFTLGLPPLSNLGPTGAVLEVVINLYLAATSMVGLYSLPMMGKFIPRFQKTPFQHVIANCILLMLLSSALPMLARTLGITNFDLLGECGRLEWLGNFKLVLLYNLAFAVSTTLCISYQCILAVQGELINMFQTLMATLWDMGCRSHESPPARTRSVSPK